MGSETIMPGTGWEKFEVLAAEVEALRERVAELSPTVADAVRAAAADVLKASNMRASPPPTATQDASEREHKRSLRPEILMFAGIMERELAANDHKGGWENDQPEALLRRLREETAELVRAVGGEGDVVSEAADVANFAMMIWDQCR